MSSFLRFNNTTEGVSGSGYEALVSLVLKKPTVRVVYAAGQILAKIDFTVNARQLQNMVFHMLEKSAFYEHKVDENISLPNYVAEGSRDSDTEDIEEKKYSNIDRRTSDSASENTQCEAEEIFGIESTAYDNKTIENLVKYLKKMTQVVQDPSKIAQIRMVSNHFYRCINGLKIDTFQSSKELPNRLRSESKSARQGARFISSFLSQIEIVKICLGILHVPFLIAHWPVYSALSEFLLTLTSTKEGILVFCADHHSSNYIIETLLGSFEAPLKREDNYSLRTDVDTPSQLASILAIRIQESVTFF